MSSSANTPLVGGPKSIKNPDTSSGLLRSSSNAIITSLGVVRLTLAGACLFAPKLVERLFLMDLPPTASSAIRMIGAREVALGGLVLAARKPDRREALRMVLVAGICTDALDIAAGIVDFTSGSIGIGTLDVIAGTALLAIALGKVGLSSL